MITDTVNQEVADQRYAAWLSAHPDQPHPNYTDVLMHAKQTGLITQDLEKWLERNHYSNDKFPHDR